MGALGHRALLQYIESNDLAGFKAFLDTRNLAIDDRDEVSDMDYCNILHISNRTDVDYLLFYRMVLLF